MNALQLHPIVELRRFCAGCLRAIRTTRHVDAELMLDGAKEIAEDIVKERIHHDRETLRLIEKAQAPDSPGGRNITPAEAAPIAAVVTETINLLAKDDEEPKRAA